MADYKRANYLKREIELAHRNAKAADTLGRYAENQGKSAMLTC